MTTANDDSDPNTPTMDKMTSKEVGSKEGLQLYEKKHLYRRLYEVQPYSFYCENEIRNMTRDSEFVVKDSSVIKLEYLFEFKN